MQSKTVLVAFGGVSPEHEVSVLTAIQAVEAIKADQMNIVPLYLSKAGRWYTGDLLLDLENYENLDELIEKVLPCYLQHNRHGRVELVADSGNWLRADKRWAPDLALIAFHGSDGENGAFQGLCETFNLAYTGCDVLCSALGMDKVRAKEFCRGASIPVLEDYSFTESEWESDRDSILQSIDELGFPVMVKPVHLGSSIGVSRAEERQSLIPAVEMAFRYDETLLVERAVEPLKEINCSVLGDGSNCRASACERPIGDGEVLSFQDKYQSEGGDRKGMASAEREIPADIPESLTNEIQEISRRIFSLFGASGVVRLDFLLEEDTGRFYFNEINTIPGSFSFYLWEESDTSFPGLIRELMNIALKRHRRKNGRIHTYETNLLSQKAVQGIKGLKGNEKRDP